MANESTAQDHVFRIAHLSDIHFGRHFDPPLWNYVRQLLENDPPDLIVVTGDVVDSPSLLYLMLARREIEALTSMATKSKTSSAYRIVPGNHDVAIYGNVKLWPSTRYFHWIFDRKVLTDTECLPTYLEYVGSPFLVRLQLRFRVYRYLLHRIPSAFRSWLLGSTAPVTRDDDPDPLFFAYLDSNAGLRLATGRVSESQVADLKGAVMTLGSLRDGYTRAFVPRVALLHHHAMPIPYSDGNEGLTSFEPFLVLRNSGTLLRELCHQDFDLVLHGHKHYSSYSRVSFAKPEEPDGAVTIIAAGSCGVGLPEEGRNSINLVDFRCNGQITVERCMFGNGESPDTSTRRAAMRKSQLFDVPGLKLRAYRRGIELQRREVDLWYREVRIDEAGSCSGQIYFDNFRLLGKSSLRFRDIRLNTDIGTLMPEAVQPDEKSVKSGLKFEAFHPPVVSSSEHPPQCGVENPDLLKYVDDGTVVSRFHLESSQTTASEGVHYGIGYRSHNSFRISAWEAQLTSGQSAKATENISVVIKYPCRKLIMKLRLPDNLVNPNVRLHVCRLEGYPFLRLVEGEVAPFSGKAESDTDMTSYEVRNLRTAGNGEWCLEVDYPLIGYQYLLKWDVANREELTAEPIDIGRAEVIRMNYLRDLSQSRHEQIASLLSLFQSFVKKSFGSMQSASENISVCLHVLDTKIMELKLVVATPGSDSFRSHCSAIPWAKGVRGTTAKMRRPLFYVAPKLRSRQYSGTRLYSDPTKCSEQLNVDYTVLIAYPIVLKGIAKTGDLAPSPPQELIGVLSFGSDALDSRLLTLISSGTAADRGGLKLSEEFDKLPTMLYFVINGILSLSSMEPAESSSGIDKA